VASITPLLLDLTGTTDAGLAAELVANIRSLTP